MLKKYEIFEKIKEDILKKNFDIAINSLEPFLNDEEYKVSASFELARIYFERQNYDKAEKYLNDIICAQEKQDNILNETFIMLIKIYKFQNNKKSIYLLIKKIIDSEYDKDYFVDEIYDVSDIYFSRHFLLYEYAGDTKELFDWFQLIKYFVPKKSKDLLFLVHVSNFFGFHDFTKSLINETIMDNECDKYYKNAFLNELEIAEKKVILKSKPRLFWLTLSNRCNLRCFMCKTHLLKDWFLLEQDIDYLYSCFPYLEYIVWWGGEPTFIDGFKRILSDALRYPNIKHRIITNGQYLPDDLVDIILRHNIEIVFSVDYVDKEKYEKARKGASFEQLVFNIKKLSGKIKKDLLKMNVVLNKDNQKDIKNIVNFAETYGFGNVSFIPISGVDNKSLKPVVKKDTGLDNKISVNNAVYILDNNNKTYEDNSFDNKYKKDNNEKENRREVQLSDNQGNDIVLEYVINKRIGKESKNEVYRMNKDEVDKIIDKAEKKYIDKINYETQQYKENEAIKLIKKENINYNSTLKQNRDKFCNIPWGQLSIDYVQDIVPDPLCTCFYKLRLNLQEINSLSDAWNCEKIQELRRRMLNIKKCSVNCPKSSNW